MKKSVTIRYSLFAIHCFAAGLATAHPAHQSATDAYRPMGVGDFHPCQVHGHTHSNAWIVSNSGQIVQADADGSFEITLPAQGVYCLKAMADGFDEVSRPWLEVPARADVNLPLWAHPNPARRVVHGNLGHPAQLTITDGGAPVRGFDFAGTEVGSYPAAKRVWHERNRYFWTLGEYCFTATGEVKIVETTDHPELRKRGWYKGDFHAHVIHGESFYHANVQQMNFICRAERYDWIYLSGGHANDGYPMDYWTLAEYLSDDKLFLRVNNEFPKNIYGHFGNLNRPPLTTRDYPGYDMERVTNLELAEKTIYAHGGLAVPVHPIFGDVVKVHPVTGRKMFGMINNELMLWLLCRPDLVPVVDFFYFPEDRAERFWYKLLNRGYTLACSGTSDAAFDVGRSPGASHGTFARLDRVDGPSIVEAFGAGRTMVSYYGDAVLFEIDGRTSGATFRPGSARHVMKVDAFATPGRDYVLRVVRNGETFRERAFTAPADGRYSFDVPLTEENDAWYVATLRIVKDDGQTKIRSAASPIYFRGPTFRAPEVVPLTLPLPANIKERLLYLTPDEVDTDAWHDELKRLLKEAALSPSASVRTTEPSVGIRITEPADGVTVPTLSDGQKAYLALPRAERVAAFADYAKRDEMCKLTGCPKPVRIAWEGGVAPFDVTVRRQPDGRVFFRKSTAGSSVDVDNLEIARRYEVTVKDAGGEAVTTFETDDLAPRLIRVPGVPNVRDLGGWKTLDGWRVKQGLVLRTSGLNENATGLEPGRTRVTDETRQVLLGFFGIRSDIDLRSDRECLLMQGSPLGPNVKWFHLSSSAYGDMTNANARAAFKTVFSVFLDRRNYPIAFHCIGGKDRTGSVAFILGALLGVAEEDLYRDWESTGFWLDERDFIHRTRFDKLIRVFDGFPGETLHERVKAYVKDLGFTDNDIETLRDILLER